MANGKPLLDGRMERVWLQWRMLGNMRNKGGIQKVNIEHLLKIWRDCVTVFFRFTLESYTNVVTNQNEIVAQFWIMPKLALRLFNTSFHD